MRSWKAENHPPRLNGLSFAPLLWDRLSLVGVFVGLLALGCVAVYPHVETPLRPAPEGKVFDPPPPDDVLFLGFKSVQVPPRTRDGRAWDQLGQGKPDPFAKVFWGSQELVRTETARDTFTPVWPLTPVRNYRTPGKEVLRIELWNDNAINNQPICVRYIDDVRAVAAEDSRVVLDCEGGGRIEMEVRPGRPQMGLGFSYELRSQGSAITAVLPQSPAERAGVRVGDEIVAVMGKRATALSGVQLKSTINTNASTGLTLGLRSKGAAEREVRLQEGPVYSVELR
jgi:hypothetical protein